MRSNVLGSGPQTVSRSWALVVNKIHFSQNKFLSPPGNTEILGILAGGVGGIMSVMGITLQVFRAIYGGLVSSKDRNSKVNKDTATDEHYAL